MLRILCFGDSNTYGYDPRSFLGDRYDAKDRWVDLLAGLTGHTVINAGVNGQKIPRPPYSPCIPEGCAGADLLLVMLGTNDLLQGTSAEEASHRMEAFLRHMIPHCQQIILVCPPPLKRGAWVCTDQLVEESCRLADAFRLLCLRCGISCVDTRHWNIDLTFDGVHFSETGNHTFAHNLVAHLGL